MIPAGGMQGNARSAFDYPAWTADTGSVWTVILSTRVRLARNLAGFCFPHRSDDAGLRKVARLLGGTAHSGAEQALRTLRPVDVHNLSETGKAGLIDAHLISLSHATAGAYRIALIDYRSTMSIMVNEEDHVRIQVILPGLQVDTAWHSADLLDDAIAARHPFAFSDDYGYLTSSMANTGTGLRVSIMVHLPALTLLNRLESTWHAVKSLGATVRGLYGEGGEENGDVYQISNSSALGFTERQLTGRMTAVATFLQEQELKAQETIRRDQFDGVRQKVATNRQELDSATQLTAEDAMRIVSTLRLGQVLGLDTGVSHQLFCQLIASLRATIGDVAELKNRARDIFYEETRRPALIRNRIRDVRSGPTEPQPRANS